MSVYCLMFWWFVLTIKKDFVYKSRNFFAQLHTSKQLKILINNSLIHAYLDIEHMSIRDAATSSFGQEIGKLGGRSLSLPASATLFLLAVKVMLLMSIIAFLSLISVFTKLTNHLIWTVMNTEQLVL